MLKSRILILLVILLLALPFVGVKAQDGTIVEVASANPDFSTLVSLVEAAGLADTLNGEGPFTVFAPTNAAFEAVPPRVLDYLGANPELLTRVLTYHVVSGKVMAADVTTMMAPSMEMATVGGSLMGSELDIEVSDKGVTVDGAHVVTTDIEASNGVIHVIDAVLIPPITLPEVDPLAVSGNIIVAGSSTVFPVTERMADLFNQDGFSGTITVDSVGTGAGFERFCVNAETDISNASRPIKSDEKASCEANGREPIGFFIAIDALSVVVSQENTFANDLTIEQLAGVFSGELATWGQVYPELAGTEDDQPIKLYSPGTDSGTFDYFVEAVFDKNEEPILNAPGIQLSEDDNVLVQGVLGSKYAIGYFGYAYYQENLDTLRAVAIESVVPSEETGASGEYPLSRPLYIYSAPTILAEKPQVATFVNYYITHVQEQLGPNADQIGYIPVPKDIQNLNKLEWLAATAGAM